jgi:argininosuccinate lyase
LWLRRQCSEQISLIRNLISVSCQLAEDKIDILQAGYTHMQPAQVVRFSHWLLSHTVALLRDLDRLRQVSERVNVCPLGSGALAGHAFGIDRQVLHYLTGIITTIECYLYG